MMIKASAGGGGKGMRIAYGEFTRPTAAKGRPIVISDARTLVTRSVAQSCGVLQIESCGKSSPKTFLRGPAAFVCSEIDDSLSGHWLERAVILRNTAARVVVDCFLATDGVSPARCTGGLPPLTEQLLGPLTVYAMRDP